MDSLVAATCHAANSLHRRLWLLLCASLIVLPPVVHCCLHLCLRIFQHLCLSLHLCLLLCPSCLVGCCVSWRLSLSLSLCLHLAPQPLLGASASTIHHTLTFHHAYLFGWLTLCLVPHPPPPLIVTLPGATSCGTPLVQLVCPIAWDLGLSADGFCVASHHTTASCASMPLVCDSAGCHLLQGSPPYPSRTTLLPPLRRG